MEPQGVRKVPGSTLIAARWTGAVYLKIFNSATGAVHLKIFNSATGATVPGESLPGPSRGCFCGQIWQIGDLEAT